jgi:hypothetical protein
MKDSWLPLIEEFKKQVSEHSSEIDPNDEEDWKSLTLGWAVAKGLNYEEAREFSLYIRYNTNLG